MLHTILLSSIIYDAEYIPHAEKLAEQRNMSTFFEPYTVNYWLYDILLYEGFEDDTFPPEGWELVSENSQYSWQTDTNNTYKGNQSVCCRHDPEKVPQNEWIITPEINLEGYTEVFLSFYWFMSYFWSVYPYNNYDFNVYIDSDNGTDWINIWNEETLGQFENWIWHNTSLGKSIDLSPYIHQHTIQIAFQYYGTDGAQLNLDEIYIYGIKITNPPVVNAGGPYFGYVGEQLKFYGTVTGGESPYRWAWYFGDGNQSNQQNPMHTYNKIGNYSVQVEVTDKFGITAHDETIAYIKNMSKVPELIINNISGPLGIQAIIKNKGCINATNVQWKIHIGNKFFSDSTTGTISYIEKNCYEQISSDITYGVGIVTVTILVDADYMNQISKHRTAFMVGRYLFIIN